MSVLISKGTANNSSIYTSDTSNISNTNNQVVFGKVLSGKVSTPMFDYLMDYQTSRINDVRSIMEYNYGNISLEISEKLDMEEIVDENTIILPKVNLSRKVKKSTLIDSLNKRKTVRDFLDTEMSLNDLSILLKYSFGIRDEVQNLNGYSIPRRYYGSGGGLYPIRPYLFINNVKDVEKGIYKYQPFSNSLRKVCCDDIELNEIFENQTSVKYNNSSFALIFVYEVNRTYVKYGELSLAHAFIEVGLMSQNLHLVSQIIGMGTCDIGGFKKRLLEDKMHLCGVNRQAIYCILVGKDDSNVGI